MVHRGTFAWRIYKDDDFVAVMNKYDLETGTLKEYDFAHTTAQSTNKKDFHYSCDCSAFIESGAKVCLHTRVMMYALSLKDPLIDSASLPPYMYHKVVFGPSHWSFLFMSLCMSFTKVVLLPVVSFFLVFTTG